MVGSSLVGIFAAVFVFTAHQVYTYPSEDIQSRTARRERVLTPEEQDLANGARAQIAQVLEANLIKFFTLVAAEDGRAQFARQEEDDDDGTLNPNTLPQVAQILGAIFAGNLNLTSIVDKTFGLVPDALRNQVDGLFKILTGQSAATTTTTTPKPAKKPVKRNSTKTTKKPTTEDNSDLFEEEDSASTKKTEAFTFTQDPIPEAEPETTVKTKVNLRSKATTARSKYTINRNKNRPSVTAVPDNLFTDEDENLYRLEQELISAAVDSEPYVSNKEPRYFIGGISDILNNFDNGRYNLTKIIKFLPDLFQGANQAFSLLEQLGELDAEDFQ